MGKESRGLFDVIVFKLIQKLSKLANFLFVTSEICIVMVKVVMRSQSAACIMLMLLLTSMQGSIVNSSEIVTTETDFSEWPEGENAYDNMVQLTQFGYRKIDTSANENARNWIASELESFGYEVERQPFTTAECTNCENIVVTIEGKLDKDWIVVSTTSKHMLLIEQVLDSKGNNIINKIKPGDRFYTPQNELDKSKKIRREYLDFERILSPIHDELLWQTTDFSA